MSVTFYGLLDPGGTQWRQRAGRELSGSDSLLASSCSPGQCPQGQQELFSSGLAGMRPCWKGSERAVIYSGLHKESLFCSFF